MEFEIGTGEVFQKQVLNALNNENDLACALLTTAIIEHMIEELIIIDFPCGDQPIKRLPFRGLDTIRQYAINKKWLTGINQKNLKLVGDLRNCMAHRPFELDFSHKKILDLANQLKLFPLPENVVSILATMDPNFALGAVHQPQLSTRSRFLGAAILVIFEIEDNILSVVNRQYIELEHEAIGVSRRTAKLQKLVDDGLATLDEVKEELKILANRKNRLSEDSRRLLRFKRPD